MDYFNHESANPAFAASVLALAWIVAALPQGAFEYRTSRAPVADALVGVARCGLAALALLVGGLYLRALASGGALSPQDVGFAAGILPIVGAWRYVLADTTNKMM